MCIVYILAAVLYSDTLTLNVITMECLHWLSRCCVVPKLSKVRCCRMLVWYKKHLTEQFQLPASAPVLTLLGDTKTLIIFIISGPVDFQWCGRWFLSGRVGMPGPSAAESVQGRDVRELQEPGVCGWGQQPCRASDAVPAFNVFPFIRVCHSLCFAWPIQICALKSSCGALGTQRVFPLLLVTVPFLFP